RSSARGKLVRRRRLLRLGQGAGKGDDGLALLVRKEHQGLDLVAFAFLALAALALAGSLFPALRSLVSFLALLELAEGLGDELGPLECMLLIQAGLEHLVHRELADLLGARAQVASQRRQEHIAGAPGTFQTLGG